jgi:phosphate transport system substrate-binding protein
MVNKDGKMVAPDSESFTAAASNANWDGTPGFGVLLTNEAGAAAWPIAGATFILMHTKAPKPADSAEALKFFSWAFAKGGKMAEDLDYVPMPANVVGAIKKSWLEIKDDKGQPVYKPAP